MRLDAFVVMAGIVAAAACSSDGGGGGGGGGGDGDGDGGSLSVTVIFEILNENGDNTITRVQCFWDGRSIDDQTFTSGTSSVAAGGGATASPGKHTATLKLVGQSVSSSAYTIYEDVHSVNNDTGATQEISPSSFSRTLHAGDSINFSVTLQ
ncbi:MAG: hypothetical protein ACREL5_00195 [Gemmatimonadales bacterium]